MVSIVGLILSMNAPMLMEGGGEPGQAGQKKSGLQTSVQRLQLVPQGQRGPTPEEKERNRVRLGITQQQQQQIDDLYNETRLKMDEVRRAMGEAQRKLWEVYAEYDIDETRGRSLRIEVLRLHRKMGEIQLENERKIRSILSREQFAKLRELMKEQFEKRRQEFDRRRSGGRP